MFKLLAVCLIFATLASAKVLPFSQFRPSSGRIVGGQDAKEGQFPYQVSIRVFGSHYCGGSIYNKRWIVTAAHCLEGLPSSFFEVVTGSTRLNTGGRSYKVETKIINSDWNSNELSGDVGLIKLASDIVFDSNVAPIPLSSKFVGAATAIASGWGTTSYPGSTPNNLQWIEIQTITNDECRQRHGSDPVRDTAICTFTKSGEGMCHGDSGGPLVVDGELTGIVSWGRPCAIGYPDVFTRVFSYKQWIEQTAGPAGF